MKHLALLSPLKSSSPSRKLSMLAIHLYQALLASTALAILAGCMGPLVRIETIDKQTIDKVKVFADMSVLKNPHVRTLGVIAATSCRNQAWEPPASVENCTNQMQMRAANLGANGIVLGEADGKVADFFVTGINRNCWSTVDCTGVAIIIQDEQMDK